MHEHIESFEQGQKFLDAMDITSVSTTILVGSPDATIYGAEQLQQEFEQILTDFPELIVICPHFCLSSINITRFEYLMDKYPNLYTDISFGFFAKDGFERMSANTSKYIPVIEKYKDRIFFGTDMVVTSHPRKTTQWMANLTMCYRNLLEKGHYSCNVGQEISAEYNGLALNEDTLKKIYQENPKNF